MKSPKPTVETTEGKATKKPAAKKPAAKKPTTKKKKISDPKVVRPDDINPHHNWSRPVGAPGHTQVDFEERVDFRRLHNYRLARTRNALAQSDLGALLVFDQYNIRYISSTVIGEWARDKLTRYSLLTGTGDPYIWDFGSAARHHKLYCPWLDEDHVRAGNPGMRGAIGPSVGLFEAAAKEIKDILIEDFPRPDLLLHHVEAGAFARGVAIHVYHVRQPCSSAPRSVVGKQPCRHGSSNVFILKGNSGPPENHCGGKFACNYPTNPLA